jgi:hypothetical protein
VDRFEAATSQYEAGALSDVYQERCQVTSLRRPGIVHIGSVPGDVLRECS